MSAELEYTPVTSDAPKLVAEVAPDELLVVGRSVPSTVGPPSTVRRITDPGVELPQGVYVFRGGSHTQIMIVDAGSLPSEPAEAGWHQADHALVSAAGWLEALWEQAEPVPHPLFQTGDLALLRNSGQEALVRSRQFGLSEWHYQVRIEKRTSRVSESDLAIVEVDDPYTWIEQSPASAKRFAATLTRAKLHERLTDTVFSFRATRTVFRAYQFRPIIRLLQTGQSRLLIADEVGLGKTIEAGLVWTELDARNQANRVLVICPSTLVTKWQGEMRERFDRELVDLDGKGLDDLLERFENDQVPRRYSAVCSLQRLRVWNGLERFAEIHPRFDLVIADEAHAFRNAGTKSHALGELLAEWADALILLSATPLNLGNDDLFNLLQLLAPEDFDDRNVLDQRLEPNAVLHSLGASLLARNKTNADRLAKLREVAQLRFGSALTRRPEYGELARLLSKDELSPEDVARARRSLGHLHTLSAVVTRTRKVEVQERKAMREARRINVDWTTAESEFYAAFREWQIALARSKDHPIAFATQMPLRLASTCLPAAKDRVLTFEDGGGDEDLDAPADAKSQWSMDRPPAELVKLAKRVRDVDTKFDEFVAHLSPIVDDGRQVLVFTFSRDALAYLERRLADKLRVGSLHGGVDRESRQQVMRDFRNQKFDVLLASRVASEGLDFEFCSAIVNYDLPWNPMEVEQRIGRIDRFGQTEEKILILNFHTPGTIESDIIERVHQRIGIFEDSIGELEPILQSKIADLEKTMFDFRLSEEQRQRQLDLKLAAIEEQRMAVDDVESASTFLASTDQAEIDGLETDLITSGRYIGQRELVLLLEDWAEHSPGSTCELAPDNTHLTFRGSAALESHLRGVEAAGERSQSEIEVLAQALLDEREILICLDQEHARTSSHQLLTANHPFVRAALRVPGSTQARYSSVRVTSSSVDPGSYLVLVAIARWTGLQPTVSLWTSSVDPATGRIVEERIGNALVAGLADAELQQGDDPDSDGLYNALRIAEQALGDRQEQERAQNRAANEALLETRRISLHEAHDVKVRRIQQRIQTLRASGNDKMIPLNEAQLVGPERNLRRALEDLDTKRDGSMEVEPIAVCVLEVVRP